MRCYNCNSVLSESNFCGGCGIDVTVYKRIVKMSNTYYNMGLAKAQVRDLCGAADLLRRSIRLNKKNIQARNLLGLVYFEMGECVSALSEWVISKNFQPHKNIADNYLKLIQSNPTRLDTMNQTIKKYNQALEYANQKDYDMAVIQLKKVLSLNPNLIKGHQLLALVYIKNKEYSKAKKAINRSLKIDFSNTLSLRYLQEISALTGESDNKSVEDKRKEIANDEDKPYLSGNDVIIPQNSYKELNNGAFTVINVVIGIIIGAAMVYFLITPARAKSLTSDYNETIKDYSANIAKLNVDVSDLEKQNSELSSENESLLAQANDTGNVDEVSAAYELLSNAAASYIANDKVGCADALSTLKSELITTDKAKALYDTLKTATYPEAATYYGNLGTNFYNKSDWDNAITNLTKTLSYNGENAWMMYQLAKAYRSKNNEVNDDNAIQYFRLIIEKFPGTDYAGWSQGYLQ